MKGIRGRQVIVLESSESLTVTSTLPLREPVTRSEELFMNRRESMTGAGRMMMFVRRDTILDPGSGERYSK
jgi:hypothetical protein